MSITVIATIVPLAGQMDAVREAFLAVVPLVHEEDGCELYSLHEAADRFVMVEQWSSREALAVHSGAAALRALGPRLEGRLTGPADVLVLDPLPAGTDQGRLR